MNSAEMDEIVFLNQYLKETPSTRINKDVEALMVLKVLTSNRKESEKWHDILVQSYPKNLLSLVAREESIPDNFKHISIENDSLFKEEWLSDLKLEDNQCENLEMYFIPDMNYMMTQIAYSVGQNGKVYLDSLKQYDMKYRSMNLKVSLKLFTEKFRKDLEDITNAYEKYSGLESYKKQVEKKVLAENIQKEYGKSQDYMFIKCGDNVFKSIQ